MTTMPAVLAPMAMRIMLPFFTHHIANVLACPAAHAHHWSIVISIMKWIMTVYYHIFVRMAWCETHGSTLLSWQAADALAIISGGAAATVRAGVAQAALTGTASSRADASRRAPAH